MVLCAFDCTADIRYFAKKLLLRAVSQNSKSPKGSMNMSATFMHRTEQNNGRTAGSVFLFTRKCKRLTRTCTMRQA